MLLLLAELYILRSKYYKWLDKCDTFRRNLHDTSKGFKDDIEAIFKKAMEMKIHSFY